MAGSQFGIDIMNPMAPTGLGAVQTAASDVICSECFLGTLKTFNTSQSWSECYSLPCASLHSHNSLHIIFKFAYINEAPVKMAEMGSF